MLHRFHERTNRHRPDSGKALIGVGVESADLAQADSADAGRLSSPAWQRPRPDAVAMALGYSPQARIGGRQAASLTSPFW